MNHNCLCKRVFGWNTFWAGPPAKRNDHGEKKPKDQNGLLCLFSITRVDKNSKGATKGTLGRSPVCWRTPLPRLTCWLAHGAVAQQLCVSPGICAELLTPRPPDRNALQVKVLQATRKLCTHGLGIMLLWISSVQHSAHIIWTGQGDFLFLRK